MKLYVLITTIFLSSLLFSQTKAPESKPKSKVHLTEEQQRAKDEAYTDDLVKGKSVEVEAKRQTYVDEFTAEYVQDVIKYEFYCQRWGQWLQIAVARTDKDNEVTKFSTSINLDLVTTLSISEGHPPDSEGVVTYSIRSNVNVNKVPATSHEEAYANFPSPPSYKIFDPSPVFIISNGYGYYICCGTDGYETSSMVNFKTEHYPRPAEDDIITFGGMSAKLYVPAGLGEEVYQEIITAVDVSKKQQ